MNTLSPDTLRAELDAAHQTIRSLRDEVHGLSVEVEDLERQLEERCAFCQEDAFVADRVEELEEAIADLKRGVITIYELYDKAGLR